jgi:ComF family protein
MSPRAAWLTGTLEELAPALALFWPGPCFACGADLPLAAEAGACPACWAALPRRTGPGCPVCDLPGASITSALDCPDCRAARAAGLGAAGALARTVAAFEYRDAVVALHRRFKFGGDAALARPLARAMAAAWTARGDGRPDLVVPVPPDPLRWSVRRHAPRRLARAVARALVLPVAPRALRKRRPTRPQTSAAGAARRFALAGAFAARSGLVEGRSILLVDDVATTGSTLREAARALAEAGADRVAGLALARRP